MAIDWLNENARRAYPFVEGSPAGKYLESIVDAVFTLGSDFDFDFNEETSELRLVSVAFTGGQWVITFRYYQHNAAVAGTPDLVFTRGPGGLKDVVLRASTANSHGFITIGDPADMAVETPGAALEARTILSPVGGSGQTVKVYNADRRKSYRPYFIADPGKTPAENFNAAKATAPAWKADVCLSPPEGILTGTVYWVPGFNTTILPSLSTQTIYLGFSLGAGGCNLCGVYDYVQSKMGTADLCADLNKDGIVDTADLAIAASLQVAPKEITFQGSLRSFNGALPSGGDLVITTGSRVSVQSIQDTNTLELSVQEPVTSQSCLTKT